MENRKELLTLRKEYSKAALSKRSVAPSPFSQFEIWFQQAFQCGNPEPNAMALATHSPAFGPSVRMVLLKDWSEEGFSFFTSYESRKGLDIHQECRVALLFYWPEIERQIRIEGTASKTPPSVSDAYFAARPRRSQLSAAVSLQSQTIGSRDELEAARDTLDKSLGNTPVTRPASWGGYLVRPSSFEFWQGREDRLHDRIIYELSGSSWQISRRAP